MHKLMRLQRPFTTRFGRAATLAVAAAAAAAIGAGPRHAANQVNTNPTGGVLTIDGTNAGDRIAGRLQAGNPAVLQVDVGDDGTAEASFPRADVRAIGLDGGNGDDALRVDESNGVFTDTIA